MRFVDGRQGFECALNTKVGTIGVGLTTIESEEMGIINFFLFLRVWLFFADAKVMHYTYRKLCRTKVNTCFRFVQGSLRRAVRTRSKIDYFEAISFLVTVCRCCEKDFAFFGWLWTWFWANLKCWLDKLGMSVCTLFRLSVSDHVCGATALRNANDIRRIHWVLRGAAYSFRKIWKLHRLLYVSKTP